MMDVSISIASYNTGDRLCDTLRAIFAGGNSISFEVIVVDNASADGTLERIRRDFPQVQLIANTENRYFSPAHNQASSIAKGKYFLILNSDITLERDTLSEMVCFLDSHLDVGAISPVLYDRDGLPQRSCWNAPTLLEIILTRNPQMYLFGGFYNGGYKKRGRVSSDGPKEVEVVSDACMMIRTNLFLKIGGYDTNMLMYCTEDDICHRVWKARYKVCILPQLRVTHVQSYSTRRSSWRRINEIKVKDTVTYFRKYHNHASTLLVALSMYVEHLLGIGWKWLWNRLN
jgi:GT2 family glycosyltransferase